MSSTAELFKFVNNRKIYFNQLVQEVFKPNKPGFGKESILVYIENLTTLVMHTPEVLKNAMKFTLDNNDLDFHEYLIHKNKEELGHENWGFRDIKRISGKEAEPELFRVIPSMQNIIDYSDNIAKTRPLSLIAYSHFSESITVEYGQTIADLIGEYGIEEKSFSVIMNHAKLDVKHIAENEVELTRLEKTGKYNFHDALLDVIHLSELVDAFYQEVSNLKDHEMEFCIKDLKNESLRL